MKKIKFLLLAVFAVLSFSLVGVLTACQSGGGEKVMFISMDGIDSHWVNVNEGCIAGAALLKDRKSSAAVNIDYTWSFPSDGKDDTQQVSIINSAVADGVKVILIAAHSVTAQNSALIAAKAAGVKIIYLDSPATEAALQTISTDNTEAGRKAANAMLEKLAADGKTSGEIGIISPDADTGSTNNRMAGFVEVIEADGKFTCGEPQYCDGGKPEVAKTLASSMIADGVVAIFGANEGSTSGAADANAAKAIIIVGFDMSAAIQGYITSGALYATVQQEPMMMGLRGMLSAGNLLLNGKIQGAAYIDSGCAVVKA